MIGSHSQSFAGNERGGLHQELVAGLLIAQDGERQRSGLRPDLSGGGERFAVNLPEFVRESLFDSWPCFSFQLALLVREQWESHYVRKTRMMGLRGYNILARFVRKRVRIIQHASFDPGADRKA